MADENNEMKEEVKDEQELASFDPTNKKKKKKVVLQDPVEDSTGTSVEKSDSLPVNDGLESSFAGLKKKKKKPVESSSLNNENVDAAEDLDELANDEESGKGIDLQQQRYPWEGSDRDYLYDVECYLWSFLVESLTFSVKIIRSLLEIGVVQL